MKAEINLSALFTDNDFVKAGDSAEIEIRKSSDGSLATLWQDREGNTLVATNPFTADADGRFTVFVDAGTYKIKATGSSSVHTIDYFPAFVDGFGDVDISNFVQLSTDNTFTGKNAFADAGNLIISAGEITITGVSHTVDTESAAATDDLATINGGVDGEIAILRPDNDARSVVIKNGTGNIVTNNGGDITLVDTDDFALLVYDSEKAEWAVLASKGRQIADQATAEGGTDNTKVMTPLRTQQLLEDNLFPEIAAASFGAIGTYVLARLKNENSFEDPGGTISGANLIAAGYAGNGGVSTADPNSERGGVNTMAPTNRTGGVGATLSGTWRAMGAPTSYSTSTFGFSLFLRIS